MKLKSFFRPNAQSPQELEQCRKKSRELEGAVEAAENVIGKLIKRHYNNWPVPPLELRLHVGARDSMANFWLQGMNSSTRVMEIFGEQPTAPMLDWGCGSGRTLTWLQGYPGWKKTYHGCDVDAEAIQWLQTSMRANVTLCGDLPPLPYAAESFGGLFAFSVLTHIHPQRHRQWYAELHRVLMPGGRAYVTQHGASIAQHADRPAIVTQQFDRQGWAWLEHAGHYKNASMVSESFTQQCLAGLFEVEDFKDCGYQNQDAYLLRRLG
ncbi:MAG: methyltransferase [Pedosphaera sp.]|nr:methyltransferase [Pedosphaera sp.]